MIGGASPEFASLGGRLEQAGACLDIREKALGLEGTNPDLILAECPPVNELRALRQRFACPIIFCAAEDGSEERAIQGLESGADDWLDLGKLFPLHWAKIRAWLRRAAAEAEKSSVQIGELTVDWNRREVRRNDDLLPLNAVEFNLLRFFILNAGAVLTRDEISRALYDREFNGLERTIDIHICRLRHLIRDDPRVPAYIKTVRGQGYLFLIPRD